MSQYKLYKKKYRSKQLFLNKSYVQRKNKIKQNILMIKSQAPNTTILINKDF